MVKALQRLRNFLGRAEPLALAFLAITRQADRPIYGVRGRYYG